MSVSQNHSSGSIFDSVGWALTAHATKSLRRVRRDGSRALSSRALIGVLRERGLPVFDAALNFEARFGGTDFGWRESTFGVYAAISAWERGAAVRLSESILVEHDDGTLLLPIAFDETNFESGFWIDDIGVIYYDENLAEAYAYDEELAETYAFASTSAVFLERLAFLVERGRWRDPRFTDSDGTLVVHRKVGALVARALGVPRFAAASDAFSSTWHELGRALIIEEATYWRSTTITAPLDVMVSAARTVSEQSPGALAEWCGDGTPPGPDEPIAARVPTYDVRAGHHPAGELLFIGTPGNYRVHQSCAGPFGHLPRPNLDRRRRR